MEKQDKATLLAVGDIHPNRDESESIFVHSAPILREGDITFGQLEINFSERHPSGSHARRSKSSPQKRDGFNLCWL